MTERELRRLRRRDLIEIIYEMKKHEKQLQEQLDQAQERLKDREIRLSSAGSIAEAALAVNGVFEAAQAAAEDYLQSLKNVSAAKED